MLFNHRYLAVPAIVCAMAGSAFAQDQGLKAGSPAPELKIENWIQGDVAGLSNAETTYIVEFWATWCGPCMRSIPHLNELYQRYKSAGLVIIGISDESASTVKAFVRKKGNGMSYPVAVDNSEKSINNNWMKAANQNGIPCAFVVRGGKVMWIGNPLDESFDFVVTSVMRGRYDPALTSKAQPVLAAAREAIKVKNYRDAQRHFDAVIELDQQLFGEVAAIKYESLIADSKDPVAARKWGENVLTKWADDKYALTDLTRMILLSDRIQKRDFELASQATDRLMKLVPSSDPVALNLQARVNFAQGNFAAAEELQYKAWLSSAAADKADQKKLLDDYRKASKGQRAKLESKSEDSKPEEPKSNPGEAAPEQKPPTDK